MTTQGTIIAFPAAGGGKWMFSRLRQALQPELDLVIPDLPGRGKRARDTSVQSVADLVTELCEELRPDLRTSRYVVFGSCFGSLIAFELLREIRRRGYPMADAFVVSARKPPDLAESYRTRVGRTDEQIGEYLDLVLPSASTTPMLSSLRGLLIRHIRTDVQIGANYDFRPEPVLELPIYAYRGADDGSISADELKTWQSHTSGSFAMRTVSGGRDFYMTETGRLVADLRRVLS